MAIKHTEAMIQRAVMEYLALFGKTHPIYFARTGAGAVRTQSGGYFKTGRPGFPDICVCSPVIGTEMSDGHGIGMWIGLEIKTKTGRMSQNQKQAKIDIELAGGKYYIIRSLADIKEIFPL